MPKGHTHIQTLVRTQNSSWESPFREVQRTGSKAELASRELRTQDQNCGGVRIGSLCLADEEILRNWLWLVKGSGIP